MRYFQANKNNENLLISSAWKNGVWFFVKLGFPPHCTGGQVRLMIIGSSGLRFDNIKHIILT